MMNTFNSFLTRRQINELEPFWLLGLDTDLHFLVTELCNGAFICDNLAQGEWGGGGREQPMEFFIYDSTKFCHWISLNSRVMYMFKSFFQFDRLTRALLIKKSIYVFYG